jgi:hypothetical protein
MRLDHPLHVHGPLHGPMPPDMWSLAKHACDYGSTVFGPGGLFYTGLKMAYRAMLAPCCLYATRAKIVYDKHGRYVHLAGCTRKTPLADLRYRLWCLREGLREGLEMPYALRETWPEARDYWRPECRAAIMHSRRTGVPYQRPDPDELERQRAYLRSRDSAACPYR